MLCLPANEKYWVWERIYPLESRVKAARLGALFVSLHMNSSQPSQSTLCGFGLNACSNAVLANALYKTGKRREGRGKTNNVVLTLPRSYLIMFCLIVGGNLLSHTLPGAVPSARAGLASGFGMGNRAFPCRYRHRQIIGTNMF